MGYGYEYRSEGGNHSRSSGYDGYNRRDESSHSTGYGSGSGSYGSRGYDNQRQSYSGRYSNDDRNASSASYNQRGAEGYTDRSYGDRDRHSNDNYNQAITSGNRGYGGGSSSYKDHSYGGRNHRSKDYDGRYGYNDNSGENSSSYNGRRFSDTNGSQDNYTFKQDYHTTGSGNSNSRNYKGSNSSSFRGRDSSRNNEGNGRDSRSYGNGNRSYGRDSRDREKRSNNSDRRGYNGGGRGCGKIERGPGVGGVEGSGYERIGDSIMDPRQQELWIGRAAPLDVKPEDPDLQQETQIGRRPDFGTAGRAMQVNVNYFGISLDSAPVEIFKYHVDVVRSPFPDAKLESQSDSKSQNVRTERPLPRAFVRSVINAALRQYESEFQGVRVVHDGMSALFSPKKLEWNAKEFADVNPDGLSFSQGNLAQHGRPPRTFIVKMKLAETIAINSLENHYKNPKTNVMPVLQALDVVARHLGAQRLITVGRNFFAMKKTHELKGGKELCWGYHQAIRVAEKKLLLNVDQAATVFYQPCELMKLVLAALNVRSPGEVHTLSEREVKNLARHLRNVEVVPTHRKDRKRAIFGVSCDRADRTMVDIKGEMMSVADYFLHKYQTRLQYPNLPLVNVGSKKTGRDNWLPVELCEVAPGHRCTNINDLDTAEIIRQTSQVPHVRRDTILRQTRQAGFENDPFLAAFGIKVDQQLQTVDVRVLEPPDVQYANVSERPSDGQWNLIDKKFVKGAVLKHWGVVVDANVNDRDVSDFLRDMVQNASKCGLLECRDPFVLDRFKSRGEVEELMKNCYREMENRNRPPQLIMVIKQDKSSVSYGRIKRASDTVLGVPSQCIVAASLRKKSPQLCANVCLKMNMKLNGKNSILREPLPLVSSCPTIVIGADVEHPRSGMGSRPSIAAVVASMDSYSAKYIGRVAAQKAANDIQQLPHMLRDLFLAFYKHTDRRPERVIYYRNGVSEGRFNDILQTEMRALRKTFKTLSEDYNPPVTFVVVNKRHHLRAFPVNSHDGDKKGNIVSGTVLDKGVVSPHLFDFYLYGHSGIQGVSVPCHYTVLHDENDMAADEVQRLTYHLGYNFARCTRSVSFVTPAYYAHLAARRAQFFLLEGSSDTASDSASFDFAKLHKNMVDCMFYV